MTASHLRSESDLGECVAGEWVPTSRLRMVPARWFGNEQKLQQLWRGYDGKNTVSEWRDVEFVNDPLIAHNQQPETD
jgi:hypothetical protein